MKLAANISVSTFFQPDRILLLLTVLLVGTTAVQILWPVDIQSQPVTGLPSTANDDSKPYSGSHLNDIDYYEIIVNRPLFKPDRSLFVEEVTPVTATPVVQAAPQVPETVEPEIPEFELQGIIRTPNATMALLKAPSQQRVSRVRLNDSIEGWELVKIESNLITLQKGTLEHQMFLIEKEQ